MYYIMKVGQVMRGRKGDIKFVVGLVLALVVMFIAVLIIYKVKTQSSGIMASAGCASGVSTLDVSSCACMYADNLCPAGETKTEMISEACPKTCVYDPASVDSIKNFVKARKKAQVDYAADVAAMKTELADVGFKDSDAEPLKYNYFGKCCVGPGIPVADPNQG
jgi:hypothetical protein